MKSVRSPSLPLVSSRLGPVAGDWPSGFFFIFFAGRSSYAGDARRGRSGVGRPTTLPPTPYVGINTQIEFVFDKTLGFCSSWDRLTIWFRYIKKRNGSQQCQRGQRQRQSFRRFGYRRQQFQRLQRRLGRRQRQRVRPRRIPTDGQRANGRVRQLASAVRRLPSRFRPTSRKRPWLIFLPVFLNKSPSELFNEREYIHLTPFLFFHRHSSQWNANKNLTHCLYQWEWELSLS